jgi:hypothetical protein
MGRDDAARAKTQFSQLLNFRVFQQYLQIPVIPTLWHSRFVALRRGAKLGVALGATFAVAGFGEVAGIAE